MSKQYYNQHIDQAIRYIILTNVGALVGPCRLGDLDGLEVSSTSEVGYGVTVGLEVSGLSVGDAVCGGLVGLGVTSATS